uniref:MAP6 domain containing 1 n=1 Tax=Pelusios castaneus TaxID=367368 RepID=A0A8C8VHL1_9SAUR
MAWPCISRVCCLARFWSQLDKSDLAVPLTIHSYSDIEEPEEAADGQRTAGPPPAQDSLAVKRTQYRRDFRAWPLQKRDACPWASDGGRDGAAARSGSARSVYVLPAGSREPRPEGSRLPGLPQSCPRSPANTTSYSARPLPIAVLMGAGLGGSTCRLPPPGLQLNAAGGFAAAFAEEQEQRKR